MSGDLGAFPIGFKSPPAASSALPITRVNVTSDYTLQNSDKGKWLRFTGSPTLTYPAASKLDSDFYCFVENGGSGIVSVAREGTTTVDGLTGYWLYQGEARRVDRTSGTTFTTKVLTPFYRTITATEIFTTPPGYTYFVGLLWGGGGSGSKSGGASNAGGGGGGACVQFLLRSSEMAAAPTITIGAAVAGPAGAANGVAGNQSQIALVAGDISAFGGAAGIQGGAAAGGGGGGVLSTPTTSTGGEPRTGAVGHFGGGDGGTAGAGNPSAYGGGGGAAGAGAGGASYYGGGGGGGGNATATNVGGSSVFGGAGGAGRDTNSGVDGTAPGGAGGGTRTGAKAGDGARGECRIWGIPA
jgi:hypothetical protein